MSKQPWMVASKEDIWDKCVFEHHCLGQKYSYTVQANAEKWEELMDWCLANLEYDTWCWEHTGSYVGYTLKFLHERDAILARLTWE